MLDVTTIIGRVGADPQVTDVQGSPRARFNVAIDRSYTNEAGERVDRTTWLRCVAWRSTADLVMKHVRKGRLVAIEGHHETQTQYDDAGEFLREHVWITIDRLTFLDKKDTGLGPQDRAAAAAERWQDSEDQDQQARARGARRDDRRGGGYRGR